VFYVLSPSCIWCRRNQANIDKLAETKANDFRFIGLSLDESGLKEYLGEYHLKFPVYAGLTKETVESLGLGGTPQTFVVSSEGKVLKVWSGAYIESLQPDVEAFFGIRLPGLTSQGN
jgi:peroxiredoxin